MYELMNTMLGVTCMGFIIFGLVVGIVLTYQIESIKNKKK